MLLTALLEIYAADGRRHTLRALLDCGSQASFMTEKSACALMLRRYYSPVTVTTFSNTTAAFIRGKCTIQIVPSGLLTPSLSVDVSIVSQITGPSPQISVKPGSWSHINNLSLADTSYHTPVPVDLLLGADLLPLVYLEGMQMGQPGKPVAMSTIFVWVIMGLTQPCDRSSIISLCLSISALLIQHLKNSGSLRSYPLVTI